MLRVRRKDMLNASKWIEEGRFLAAEPKARGTCGPMAPRRDLFHIPDDLGPIIIDLTKTVAPIVGIILDHYSDRLPESVMFKSGNSALCSAGQRIRFYVDGERGSSVTYLRNLTVDRCVN